MVRICPSNLSLLILLALESDKTPSPDLVHILTPQLKRADYDLLSFDLPHSHPEKYLISSYIYRKAMIRKHQLHQTIQEYLVKCRHRGLSTVLETGGVPRGWTVEIQFADELDELLLDELYDLWEGLTENEESPEAHRQWYILKPGFADRAQGIRLFSSLAELQAIFESFEPPSDDENQEEGDDNGSDDEERQLERQAARLALEESGDVKTLGTGVMTSQLRHFVIQEYKPRPILFDISQNGHAPHSALVGHKFHLRAYVLVNGAYRVYLARTMLALFSGAPFVHPTAAASYDEESLRPHLTNTCLQTDEFGLSTPSEELVKLFWELEGLTPLSHSATGTYEAAATINRSWLDETFARVGEVVSESMKAGAECGSFGLQLLPNAFEIFGVDLLLSFPDSPPSSPHAEQAIPIPLVTLLEYNASPDFQQSGGRLRPELLEMFRGVVEICVKPFFRLGSLDQDEEEEEGDDGVGKAGRVRSGDSEEGRGVGMDLGDERWGWRLVGQGQIMNFGH